MRSSLCLLVAATVAAFCVSGAAGQPAPPANSTIGKVPIETNVGKTDPPLVAPLVLEHETQVVGLVYSPDARLIASSTNMGFLHLWEAATGKLLWKRKFVENGPIRGLAFSPDGKILACTAQAQVILIDVARGKPSVRLEHSEGGFVQSVCFSPDGRRLVSGVSSSMVVWDLQTREREYSLVHAKEGVAAVAFSPDGKRLACGSHTRPNVVQNVDSIGDAHVRLYDSTTGKEIAHFDGPEHGPIHSLSFSPLGNLLGYSCYTRIIFRNVDTGGIALKIVDPDGSWHRGGLVFSPDGHLVLVTGSAGSACRLCEISTGKEVQVLAKQRHYFEHAGFSPDGRAVALGSLHHSVVVQPLIPHPSGPDNLPLKQETLDRLWKELGSADVKRRYQAIWTLAAKPADTLPVLKHQVEEGKADLTREVGQSCVRVLELIESARARQILEWLSLKAVERELRHEAASALARLKARDTIETIRIGAEKRTRPSQ